MQLFEIVTGDLRAHGQSSRIPAPYTPYPSPGSDVIGLAKWIPNLDKVQTYVGGLHHVKTLPEFQTTR
ncbi:hypothetical protein KQX54_002329 [Cotesia glomerata]|uniref:Uncharacterized protein n=1 Tax=Cotesia glomerata TaxID=32391 RepID=A0AAV7J6N1_COTGL|nr:hypothetical protein KQX54_002329 [Cotesia glomerata]